MPCIFCWRYLFCKENCSGRYHFQLLRWREARTETQSLHEWNGLTVLVNTVWTRFWWRLNWRRERNCKRQGWIRTGQRGHSKSTGTEGRDSKICKHSSTYWSRTLSPAVFTFLCCQHIWVKPSHIYTPWFPGESSSWRSCPMHTRGLWKLILQKTLQPLLVSESIILCDGWWMHKAKKLPSRNHTIFKRCIEFNPALFPH